MSEDPYHAFRTELQHSLSHAHQLHSSLVRIRSTVAGGSTGGKSEELREVEDELRGTLAALEADLEELEESVRVVEQTGPRLFNISEAELSGRRAYVRDARKDIESMRADLAASGGVRLSRPPSYTTQPAGQEDDQTAWAREEQQMLVEQQDTTLHTISGALTTLAEQAGLIGREVGEHNEMLGDLESGVDRTDAKLTSAMSKLRKFIRDTEETKSGWCIVILIVVLCALLLAVVLI